MSKYRLLVMLFGIISMMRMLLELLRIDCIYSYNNNDTLWYKLRDIEVFDHNLIENNLYVNDCQ